MSRRRGSEGAVARVAGAVTAVAGAVAAVVALVPHDRPPAPSPTIQNIVRLPASSSTAGQDARSAPASARAIAPARPAIAAASQPSASAQAPASTGASTGEWTAGSAYTAILASEPTEAQARAIQREASARGLDAGVLYSSRFRSLRPGYWVVFSGAYGTADAAAARARRAQANGFAGAYPRYVSP